MSSDLHTFIQLTIVAGWMVLLLFSFFRKYEYLCLAQKLILPFVCIGFSVLNTTLFNAVTFKTDWYSVLFYISQVSTQILLALSFKQRENKIDNLKKT